MAALLLLSACDAVQLNPPEKFERVGEPQRFFVNGINKCLVSSSKKDHNLVTTDNCNSSPLDLQFESAGDRQYVLKSSQGCLAVKDASLEDGAAVEFTECNNKKEQLVTLRKSELDFLYHRIVFVNSGKCLDTVADPNGKLQAVQKNCTPKLSQNILIQPPTKKGAKVPKIIWSFWDKGKDAMPDFYRANIKHWADVLNKPGHDLWQIRVMNLLPSDPDYFGNFVDKNSLPTIDFLRSKIDAGEAKEKLNPYVIFSDFLRLEALYQHGGVWMDPSVMLHKDLNDFITAIEDLNQFTLGGYTTRFQADQKLRFADSFENFFIVSLPKTKLVQTWKENFKKYWDLKQPGMDIKDHPMYNGSQGNTLDLGNFGSLANYLNQHVALKFTIENNLDFLKEIFIAGGTGLEENGPFSLLTIGDWKDKNLIKLEPQEVDRIALRLKKGNVLISKFASISSQHLRLMPYDFFFDTKNIFGRLNNEF